MELTIDALQEDFISALYVIKHFYTSKHFTAYNRSIAIAQTQSALQWFRTMKPYIQLDYIYKNNSIWYRDVIVNFQLDDYGQQEYIEFEGRTISGGSFNILGRDSILDELDMILNLKLIKDILGFSEQEMREKYAN